LRGNLPSSRRQAPSSVSTPFSGVRRPTNREAALAVADARIRRHEVGLDHDPLGRQPALDELAAPELVQHDEGVDLGAPGAEQAMAGQHGGDRGGAQAAAAIAGMGDAGPGDAPAQAVLAHMAIAKEDAVGAEQAIVVQGLHHRAALGFRRMVHRGRDQREEVVDVDHVT
jgi:hypothetical protein